MTEPFKRRPRYRGTHPRQFHEKYKEHNPELYPAAVEKVMASGKTPAGMHRPVMLEEVLQRLDPKLGEVAVDCTLGYGGHAIALGNRVLPGGQLFAFDVDPLERPKAEARLRKEFGMDGGFRVVGSNFAGISKALAEEGTRGADVILADLGVSSMQLDDPDRGFSFKQAGLLDLRMNPGKGKPASHYLAVAKENGLSECLQLNADEPRSALLARAVVLARESRAIETTAALTSLIRSALQSLPSKVSDEEIRITCQRVFQALRIEVNDEFSALESLLRQLPGCLRAGGRVAILTFHSGEDRRVKHAFLQGWKSGLSSDIAREVVRPTGEEIQYNPRSRCAKLRWAIRSDRTHPSFGEEVHSSSNHPALLEFRTSSIHGTGAFAMVAIPAETNVIEYRGERITKSESRIRCRQDNPYVFALDETSDLDGDYPWNPARWINHSCQPNCEAIHCKGEVWIVSLRAIERGEEISFNYGYDLANYQDHPCGCGTPGCVGFIAAEEHHEEIRRKGEEPGWRQSPNISSS